MFSFFSFDFYTVLENEQKLHPPFSCSREMSVLLQQGGPAAVQLRQDRIVGRQPGLGQGNGLPGHKTPTKDTHQSVKVSVGSR